MPLKRTLCFSADNGFYQTIIMASSSAVIFFKICFKKCLSGKKIDFLQQCLNLASFVECIHDLLYEVAIFAKAFYSGKFQCSSKFDLLHFLQCSFTPSCPFDIFTNWKKCNFLLKVSDFSLLRIKQSFIIIMKLLCQIFLLSSNV